MKKIDNFIKLSEQHLMQWAPYRFAIMYRLHVSLLFLAMMLVHYSPQANINGYGPVLAFTCWHMALYIFNRYTDKAEDSRNSPGEALSERQGIIALSMTALLLLLGGAAISLSGKSIFYYIASLPLVFLYGLRIPGIRYRIKDITFIKTAYAVLVCWCLPVVLISATYFQEIYFTETLSKFCLLLFFLTTCYELLADIKDIHGDKETGVKTIAVSYGKKVTRMIVIGLLFIAWLVSFFTYNFFSYPFSTLTLVFTFLIDPERPAIYFHGLVITTIIAVMLYYFLYIFPHLSGFFF